MLLSIILLHTNKPLDAKACLIALANAVLPEQTEILVINNGGSNANCTIDPAVYKTLDVTFHELPRDGYIYGNNFGYEHCTGDYIATVNADITVEVDTIMMLTRYLEQNPQVGIVAPLLFYPSGEQQESARDFPSIHELLLRRVFGYTPPSRTPPFTERRIVGFDSSEGGIPVDWVTGAIFIMSRKFYRNYGGHDERYYLFMSDIALCRKAWDAGFEVHVLPHVRATHNHVRLSQGNLFSMLRKPTGRAHITDAYRYFAHYFLRRRPRRCPSQNR